MKPSDNMGDPKNITNDTFSEAARVMKTDTKTALLNTKKTIEMQLKKMKDNNSLPNGS